MTKSLEVLMVTMNKNDFELAVKSKITSNLIIANQKKDAYSFTDIKIQDNKEWKMITTNTVGVGINRNIALSHAKGPYCLLMDDDMICYENYEEIIISYFEKIPKADILILNINTIGGATNRRVNNKVKRINYLNFLNYGAVRIAFKLSSIQTNNIHFSTLFGGGCVYSSGEDSLFLKQCIQNKLKIYAIPYCYADVYQESSTWFQGLNEKFFYDKGALMKAMFPKFYFLFIIFFSLRFKNEKFTFLKKMKTMFFGAKNYPNLIDYQEFETLRKKGERND